MLYSAFDMLCMNVIIVTYVGRNSTVSTGHRGGGGGQLKNQQPSKAPPHPAQMRAISFGHRTKESDANVSKRHSFIS